MRDILFNNWSELLRTLVIGVSTYTCLVLLLRITGKRTLSKLNAFDFVITIALGSTLATILLSKYVTLAQGVLALALLIGLQFVITWSSVRAGWVKRLVAGEPLLPFYREALLKDALRRARVTDDEVRSAVRSAGMSELSEVEAVVLETDGSFSVIRRGDGETSLIGVRQLGKGGREVRFLRSGSPTDRQG